MNAGRRKLRRLASFNMPVSLETLADIATILGTAIALLALIQSSGLVSFICLLFVCVSVGLGYYARRKRLMIDSASIVIEGHGIDSLNIANLRRRVNRTFVVQDARHTVGIRGEDMEIEWRYSGFCRTDKVSSMEFSIDSDASIPFEQLACVAFDLSNDPEMRHPICPALVGAEGISKKISVPFLEPLRLFQPFGIILRFTLPHSLKQGFGYYTSTSSFAHTRVHRCVVHLTFFGPPPQWMRVYESTAQRGSQLVKSLPPKSQTPEFCEYIDVLDSRDGQSTRIYAFWRDTI